MYTGSRQLEDTPRARIGHPNEKGDFTLADVYPGSYRIYLLDETPSPYYLDSIRLGDLNALASDVPILSGAQPLTVTYKFGRGTVRGTVEDCGAGRVLLLPQEPGLRYGQFLAQTSCGPNGQFAFAAIRPGEYYGIAIESDSFMRWYAALRDDDLLHRGASRVTVRANQHTTVDIPLFR